MEVKLLIVDSYTTDPVFLVIIDEREWQGNVERFDVVGVGRPLAGLKGHEQVNPSGRSLGLEYIDKVGPEYFDQQLLEFLIDS